MKGPVPIVARNAGHLACEIVDGALRVLLEGRERGERVPGARRDDHADLFGRAHVLDERGKPGAEESELVWFGVADERRAALQCPCKACLDLAGRPGPNADGTISMPATPAIDGRKACPESPSVTTTGRPHSANRCNDVRSSCASAALRASVIVANVTSWRTGPVSHVRTSPRIRCAPAVFDGAEIHDRTHFDAASLCRRDFRGHLNGFIQVPRVDQVDPPSCSVVSANGPSVVAIEPLRTRTVVAVRTGCRASPAT